MLTQTNVKQVEFILDPIETILNGKFAIMSGDRPNWTQGTEVLSGFLNALNIPHVWASGIYDGERENSLVIPNIERDFVVKLGRLFNQDFVIWGEGNRYKLINQANDEAMKASSYHFTQRQPFAGLQWGNDYLVFDFVPAYKDGER